MRTAAAYLRCSHQRSVFSTSSLACFSLSHSTTRNARRGSSFLKITPSFQAKSSQNTCRALHYGAAGAVPSQKVPAQRMRAAPMAQQAWREIVTLGGERPLPKRSRRDIQ